MQRVISFAIGPTPRGSLRLGLRWSEGHTQPARRSLGRRLGLGCWRLGVPPTPPKCGRRNVAALERSDNVANSGHAFAVLKRSYSLPHQPDRYFARRIQSFVFSDFFAVE